MFMTLGRAMCVAVGKRGHLRAETTEDISFLVVRSKIAYSMKEIKKEEREKKVLAVAHIRRECWGLAREMYRKAWFCVLLWH